MEVFFWLYFQKKATTKKKSYQITKNSKITSHLKIQRQRAAASVLCWKIRRQQRWWRRRHRTHSLKRTKKNEKIKTLEKISYLKRRWNIRYCATDGRTSRLVRPSFVYLLYTCSFNDYILLDVRFGWLAGGCSFGGHGVWRSDCMVCWLNAKKQHSQPVSKQCDPKEIKFTCFMCVCSA